MDVLHSRSSRLEMVMHLLYVVVVNGRCGCYLVGGAHGAQTRWLIIPRSGLQLVFSCFLLDLARNGREAFCRIIVGYRPGVLYPCWQYNLWPSWSLALYNLDEVSKSSSLYLMLVCLARKRHYACCCRKELSCWLLVLGSIPCWRFAHTPHVRHSPVLFLFLCITWLGYTMFGLTGLSLCPPSFFFVFLFSNF
jgi:hypothetical protein